jgi:hypothetical protein
MFFVLVCARNLIHASGSPRAPGSTRPPAPLGAPIGVSRTLIPSHSGSATGALGIGDVPQGRISAQQHHRNLPNCRQLHIIRLSGANYVHPLGGVSESTASARTSLMSGNPLEFLVVAQQLDDEDVGGRENDCARAGGQTLLRARWARVPFRATISSWLPNSPATRRLETSRRYRLRPARTARRRWTLEIDH